MVLVLKNENGGSQLVSASLNKMIQSIKEIVGNHSDSDIYVALKECNMDPNDAAQKLLNQDPFHEVKRRRDKKKENAGDSGHAGSSSEPLLKIDSTGYQVKPLGFDHNAHRRGYTRSAVNEGGIGREFRIVRDNRVNQNPDRETKSATQAELSVAVQQINNLKERSSFVRPNNQRYYGRYIQSFSRVHDFHPKLTRHINYNIRKEHVEGKSLDASDPDPNVSLTKNNESPSGLGSTTSSNAVGVYASASDPVHVPSPDSRSPAAIGAIGREIGVVGGRRQPSQNASKQSSQQNISNPTPVLGNSSTSESLRSHMNSVSRSDRSAPSVEISISSTVHRMNNNFSNRLHQQPGSQRGGLPTKEWKPKTSQKSSVARLGVIESPMKCASYQADSTSNVERNSDELQEKLSQINISDSQKVVIAQHIRVPASDRCRVTFGSFGMESDRVDPSSSFQAADILEEPVEASPSSNQVNAADDQVQISAASSPSSASCENDLPDKKDPADITGVETCTDLSLVHKNSTFTTSQSQQLQESSELPAFSACDVQPAYDIPYFRPSVDDVVHGPGLPFAQEVLPSHVINNLPSSSVTMMQQQTPMAQMYQQVNLQHFANVLPYRPFIPPMYAPPMIPGYTGNPPYTHLSNGNSYVLMPGGSSHLPASSLKYGVQQLKPLPVGSPTGFGSLASSPGYAINSPGVVGGPTGLDDTSRHKYKDATNLYIPNPQTETSEVWIQNHRELPGMQSIPYFNLQGQTTHPAYMQSHTAHASFNPAAAAAQSSQMQFPGMYAPQPAGMPNAHHLGAGNFGVGMAPQAPGAQVGAYQQPQINHLNWTTNF